MWLLLGLIIVVLFLLLRRASRQLRKVGLYSNSPNPVQPSANTQMKMVQYAPLVQDTNDGIAIFSKGKEFYCVQRSSPSSYLSLREIYPSFKGIPIGLVLVPGTQMGSSGLIVFSSDGKVYNPWTTSHPWRRDFLYLPTQNPISVDGRPVSTPGNHGLFNGGAPEAGILFRFYYSGYYVEEQECVNLPASGDPVVPGTTSTPQGCSNTQVPFSIPSVKVASFYHIGDTLYAVARDDGWIYQLNNGVWSQSIPWIANANSQTGLFPVLSFPDPVPSTTKNSPVLLGADYDGTVPIFLLNENGTTFLVDRHARKYDLRKAFRNQGVWPAGNILDFTKCGPGEYDYLLLVTDGNLYGPTLPGNLKAVSDFTSNYSAGNNPVSITSSVKWIPRSQTSGYYNYFLVFLYATGEWFEIAYDIQSNTIGSVGQNDQTVGKWTSWPHVKNALSQLPCPSCFKVSSYGWSVFTVNPNNPGSNSDNMVYSINNPPEPWYSLLFCTPNSDQTDIAASACVGLGSWKDNDQGVTGANGGALSLPGGWVSYSDLGTDTVNNPGVVQYKIPLEQCLSQAGNYPAVVYDSVESDCHYYSSLIQGDAFKDPSKATFVRNNYDPYYRNRFCIQHVSSGKYLYWDFTDPDNQKLGMDDQCLYQVPDLSLASTGDIFNLTKSMGSFWSSTGNGCLQNMNGTLVGDFLNPDRTLGLVCNSNFFFQNGTFTDGKGNCLSWDGTNFNYGPNGCSDLWTITDIPCPAFSSTGYIYEYCG